MQGLGCLIVDMQDGFLKAIPNSDTITKRCQFVVEATRILDIPLFFSEQVPAKLGHTHAPLLESAKDPFIFEKNTFSAWQPILVDELKAREISHLLVGGIETTICVYQTLLAAQADECQTTLLSDCIGCRRAEDGNQVIDTLARHNILSLPSESVFYSILQSVEHPNFREFTQLVKQYA